MEAQLEDIGVSGDEREVIVAEAIAAKRQAEPVLAQMRAFMDDPANDDLAEMILRLFRANGSDKLSSQVAALRAAVAATQGLSTKSGSLLLAGTGAPKALAGVCDELLPAYCALLAAVEALDTATSVVGFACDALLVGAGGALLFPGDGPVIEAGALATWLSLCAQAEAAISVTNTVTGLVSDFDADLELNVSPTSLDLGQTASVEPKVLFIGLDDICNLGGAAATDKLLESIAERAVNELLRRKIGRTATQKLFELRGGGFLNRFLESLADVAEAALSNVGLTAPLESFFNNICGRFNVGEGLIVDAQRVMNPPSPNVGSLSFLGDGTAEYSCPESSDDLPDGEPVTLTAEKTICDTAAEKSKDISCAFGQVTITMGDNGNLNDDIFEVVVGGETVLTSSTPVRSISTTIELPAGDHVVEMIGRAAPDGIGTYFISFSGDVTNVTGDALSGTDLTPGVVKTFVITVE